MSQGQPGPRAHVTQRGSVEGPVGVFDSGVGGLTILQELLRELPGERFVYYGDTGNCPYGIRPQEEVQLLAANAVQFLLDQGAKLIVVACNAASVSAKESLRATFPFIEFVVVVPAVKPAAKRTRTGKVGIATTEVSAHSAYLQQLIDEHAEGVEVFPVGCPRLVTLAEAGKLEGPEVEETIGGYLQPMLAAGIDTLVLGCTHFPAMRAAFERVAGPGIAIIDSGAAIAARARDCLEKSHLLSVADSSTASTATACHPWAQSVFWCSGEADSFVRVASMILGTPVQAQQAPDMLLRRN